MIVTKSYPNLLTSSDFINQKNRFQSVFALKPIKKGRISISTLFLSKEHRYIFIITILLCFIHLILNFIFLSGKYMVKCRQTLYPRRFGVTRSGTKYRAEPCASPGGQHVRRTWYNRRQRGEETNQVCRRQQERGDVHLEILVTTEELLAKAEEIHNFTGRLKQQLESIETEVHTTSGF